MCEKEYLRYAVDVFSTHALVFVLQKHYMERTQWMVIFRLSEDEGGTGMCCYRGKDEDEPMYDRILKH